MDACVYYGGLSVLVLWCLQIHHGVVYEVNVLSVEWVHPLRNIGGEIGVLACFRVACWLLCQRAITRAFVDGIMVHEALRSLGNDVTVRKSALRSMSCMITTI